MRRILEISVLLLIAVLVTRVFIAEAYIVPTGSMAPALAGNHKAGNCPCCGYPVLVGHQGRTTPDGSPCDDPEANRHYAQACCPNCGWDRLHLNESTECPGDRLLVHKHVFDLRAPRRWEMIVFRNPHVERAFLADTYIKRVVGLPGEAVQVRDGDVYISGVIARKSLSEFRAMRLPVFDNAYLPKDAGPQLRWRGSQGSHWQTGNGGRSYRIGVKSAKQDYDWLTYHHLVRDRDDGKTVWVEDEIKDVAGYNGGQVQDRRIHDLLLDAEFKASGAGWLALALTDGLDDILVEVPVGLDGACTVRQSPTKRQSLVHQPQPVASQRFHMAADAVHHIEVGLIDRRVLLAIDDQEVFGNLDLPSPTQLGNRHSLAGRLAFGGTGPVSLGVYGLDVHLSHLSLFRDVHYTDRNGKQVHPNAIMSPVVLGPGEFFMLGDNSANSYDSRCWKLPAVREECLVGKAFLVHLPTRLLEWRQFGESRALAVPDWSRMKLLH